MCDSGVWREEIDDWGGGYRWRRIGRDAECETVDGRGRESCKVFGGERNHKGMTRVKFEDAC